MEDIAEMMKKWDIWVATKGKDIVGKMKIWDTWDDATKGKCTVEKMKIWDTWDAIVNDLEPYLAEVFQRVTAEQRDESLIHDFLFLKLIISRKVNAVYAKAIQNYWDSITDSHTAYFAVVVDIIKLFHNSDKLNDVLEAQTQLMNWEKEIIQNYWKNQHAVETKGDENLVVVEDSNMEEYLKAKFTELGNLKADIDNLSVILEGKEMNTKRLELRNIMASLKVERRIMHLDNALGYNRVKELIQNMMSASFSSTRVKKLNALSEDNFVASSEDDNCRQKRLKED